MKISTTDLNPNTPLQSLQFLAATSSCTRSVLSSLPACETFPKLLRVREREIQQEDDIDNPHAHDVLCGRGYSVNSHPGNVYFRSLVKRRLVHYAEAPKTHKPKIAMMIHREIRLRNPPGRFLKVDAETRLWSNIGNQRAIGKIRQALREGGQLTKDVSEECETEIDRKVIEHQCNIKNDKRLSPSPSSSSLLLPLQSSLASSANKFAEIKEREDSTSIGYVSIDSLYNEEQAARDFDESLTNLASSIIDSKWITSNNSKVIKVTKNENRSRFNKEATEGSCDYFHNNSIATNYSIKNSVREPCDTIFHGISAKIAQKSGFLPNDSLGAVSMVPLLDKKRSGIHDTLKKSNKRQRTCLPNGLSSSSSKESVSAVALLSMLHGNDHEIQETSIGNKVRVTNDGSCNDQPHRVSLLARHEMAIKDESCAKNSSYNLLSSRYENRMSRDSHLEARALQEPNSLMTTENSIFANPKVTSSADEKSKELLVTCKEQNSQTVDRPCVLPEISSSCKNQIRQAEEIWGIPFDESKKYPERIMAIEKKANEYKNILERVNSSSFPREKEKEESFSFNLAEKAQYLLEEVERKWGLKPSENLNNAERVKLIERTASLHRLQQEEQKWGLTMKMGLTCKERTDLVNQAAAAYMERLKRLL